MLCLERRLKAYSVSRKIDYIAHEKKNVVLCEIPLQFWALGWTCTGNGKQTLCLFFFPPTIPVYWVYPHLWSRWWMNLFQLHSVWSLERQFVHCGLKQASIKTINFNSYVTVMCHVYIFWPIFSSFNPVKATWLGNKSRYHHFAVISRPQTLCRAPFLW